MDKWLRQGDIIVRGEGEMTISELMVRLTKDRYDLGDIKGISFKDEGGNIQNNPSRALLTSEELSDLPVPTYNQETRDKVSTSPLETSRGCPHDCDFCSVTNFYGKSYRTKSVENVLAQFENIRNRGNPKGLVNNIFCIDDNVAGAPKKTVNLFEQLIKKRIDKRVILQTTVQSAYNERLLELFKQANVETLCVGIESIVDSTLESYNKVFSAAKNKEAIKIFRDFGFWVHGMMVLGGEGDTKESLKETSEWIKENFDSAQLLPPTPLPGTRLYERMQQEGRILTNDTSLYDCQHVVIRPKNLSPIELQETIIGMYKDFYSFWAGMKRTIKSNSPWKSAAFTLFAQTSNGFKGVFNNPQFKNHLNFLKSVS